MGMDKNDVKVYAFLFTKKLEGENQFSAAEIAKSLKSIEGFAPEEFRTSLSDTTVSRSLSKLTTMGFVVKCDNTKKAKTGGRPPTSLYQTVDLHTVASNIAERLDLYKNAIIRSLERFSYIEEGMALSESLRGSKSDDPA